MLSYCDRDSSQACNHKPPTIAARLPQAPEYVVPPKDYAPPANYMSLEEFLDLPYREVDLTQPTEVMPPPHARDIC